MTKKVFRGVFLTAVMTMLACLLFVLGLLYHFYSDRVREELVTKAVYLACGVERLDVAYLDSVGAAADRITLVAADGTVLYDNEADVAAMDNHADRKEIREALENGVGEASRQSSTLSEQTDYYALRLSDGRVLRVSADRFTVWTLLVYMLWPTLLVALLLVLLSAVVADRIARAVVKPINAMNLDAPDIDESYEELGPLLRKVNAQNRHIQKQMEELRRRETEFALIADNMSEGLLILDRRAEILSSNRSIARFFGATNELRGQNVLTLNRSEEFRRLVADVLEGQHATVILPVGGRYYEGIANPVFDAVGSSGEPMGAVVLVVDVTEREKREQLRREFTANVSHELKTPLTSIYGVSDMLMSGLVKPEDVSGFAADIHREAERLIRLVGDILRLSSLDEGGPELPREPVDLYTVAADVAERLRGVAAARQVALTLSGESAVWDGVPELLHEMVYNLCDNAIKYNRDGGQVRVSVQPLPGGGAQLQVSDSGIGIPHDQLDRVFERFYCVDKSHSKKVGGTGLGLSIVKHIVRLHGGTVAIDSTPDVGTTVAVIFGK